MKMSGYSNPLQSLQRKMAPNFAQREFADPAIARSAMRPRGLGSLRRTMPHLRRSLAGGGTLNPTGEAYASSRENLYNPDPMRRHILGLQRQMAGDMSGRLMSAMPFSGAGFAAGGPAEVMEPEEDLSQANQQERDVVIEALAALEGQHPDPAEAIRHFVEVFGKAALRDLQRIAEQQRAQGPDEEEDEEGEGPQPDEEEEQELSQAPAAPPDQDQDLAAAGGGLLRGPGTGQSDEIEATTPSGRPVLLSDGEYVIDAPTVAALGDGSSSAGARRLDQLREQIRRDAYGHSKQAKPMKKGGKAMVIRLGK